MYATAEKTAMTVFTGKTVPYQAVKITANTVRRPGTAQQQNKSITVLPAGATAPQAPVLPQVITVLDTTAADITKILAKQRAVSPVRCFFHACKKEAARASNRHGKNKRSGFLRKDMLQYSLDYLYGERTAEK